MNIFDDYDKQFPNLIMDILHYFDLCRPTNGESINDRTVLKFSQQYKKPDGQFTVNPQIVVRICDQLCQKYLMERIKIADALGFGNSYLFNSSRISNWNESKNRWNFFYSSAVYGMEYIYRYYKNIVIPIISQNDEGDISLGTGFKLFGGIVTAKHCIEDPKHIFIEGYSIEDLKNSEVFVSRKYSDIDIAFIDLQRKEVHEVFIDEGKILQDVLVMGYPKIPTFTSFITAEKATISAKAKARLTPTKGAIASLAKNIFAKVELMLITAKIRGGNSGGPIINDEGSIVGVACQQPFYDDDEVGKYDDLGYGIAIPIKYLLNILNGDKETLTLAQDFFTENIYN